MFTWIASALGSAKVWVIGAVVALAGIAFAWIRRDARRDALRDVQHETDKARLRDIEIAREIEDAVAGRSPDDNRGRLRLWTRR